MAENELLKIYIDFLNKESINKEDIHWLLRNIEENLKVFGEDYEGFVSINITFATHLLVQNLDKVPFENLGHVVEVFHYIAKYYVKQLAKHNIYLGKRTLLHSIKEIITGYKSFVIPHLKKIISLLNLTVAPNNFTEKLIQLRKIPNQDILYKHLIELDNDIKEGYFKSSKLDFGSLILNKATLPILPCKNSLADEMANKELDLIKFIDESFYGETKNELDFNFRKKELIININNYLFNEMGILELILDMWQKSLLFREFVRNFKTFTNEQGKYIANILPLNDNLSNTVEGRQHLREDIILLDIIISLPVFIAKLCDISPKICDITGGLLMCYISLTFSNFVQPKIVPIDSSNYITTRELCYSVFTKAFKALKEPINTNSNDIKHLTMNIMSVFCHALDMCHLMLEGGTVGIHPPLMNMGKSVISNANYLTLAQTFVVMMETSLPDMLIYLSEEEAPLLKQKTEHELNLPTCSKQLFGSKRCYNLLSTLIAIVRTCTSRNPSLIDGSHVKMDLLNVMDGNEALVTSDTTTSRDSEILADIVEIKGEPGSENIKRMKLAKDSLELLNCFILLAKPTKFWIHFKQYLDKENLRTLITLFVNVRDDDSAEYDLFRCALSKTVGNLISSQVLDSDDKVTLLASLGIIARNDEGSLDPDGQRPPVSISSWPLHLSPQYIGAVFQTLFTPDTTHRGLVHDGRPTDTNKTPDRWIKRTILQVWHSFLDTYKACVQLLTVSHPSAKASGVTPYSDSKCDVNPQNIQFLLFIFHALPTLSDKGEIFMAIFATIRWMDSSILVKPTKDQLKGLTLPSPLIISRIYTIFEYMIFNFYQMPNYLHQQVKCNLKNGNKMPSYFYNEVLQERLDNYKALLGITEDFTVSRYYHLQSFEVYKSPSPKIDSLACKLLVTAEAYDSFVDAIANVIDMVRYYESYHRADPKTFETFKNATDLEYLLLMVWRILTAIPPSKKMVERVAHIAHEFSYANSKKHTTLGSTGTDYRSGTTGSERDMVTGSSSDGGSHNQAYYLNLFLWVNRLDLKGLPHLSWAKTCLKKQGLSLLKSNIVISKIIRNHHYLDDMLRYVMEVLKTQIFAELENSSEKSMRLLPTLNHYYLADALISKLILNVNELFAQDGVDKIRLESSKIMHRFINFLLGLIKLLHYTIKREIYRCYVAHEASQTFPDPFLTPTAAQPDPSSVPSNPDDANNFDAYYNQAIRSIVEKVCAGVPCVSSSATNIIVYPRRGAENSSSMASSTSSSDDNVSDSKTSGIRYSLDNYLTGGRDPRFYAYCQMASISSENMGKFCLADDSFGSNSSKKITPLLPLSLSFCLDKWDGVSIHDFPTVATLSDPSCPDYLQERDAFYSNIIITHFKILSRDNFDSCVSLKRTFSTCLTLLAHLIKNMNFDKTKEDIKLVVIPVMLDARTDYVVKEILPDLQNMMGPYDGFNFRYDLSLCAIRKCQEILRTLSKEWYSENICLHIINLLTKIVQSDYGVASFCTAFKTGEDYMGLFRLVYNKSTFNKIPPSNTINHAILSLFETAFHNLASFNLVATYMESLDNFITTFLLIDENIDFYVRRLICITEGDTIQMNDALQVNVVLENCINFYHLINRTLHATSITVPQSSCERIIQSLGSIITKQVVEFGRLHKYTIFLASSYLFLSMAQLAFVQGLNGITALTLYVLELLKTFFDDHYVQTYLSNQRTPFNPSGKFYTFLSYLFSYINTIFLCVDPHVEKMEAGPNESSIRCDTLDMLNASRERNFNATSLENFEDSMSDELESIDYNYEICTFTFTNKEFIDQHWYHCHTCQMVDGMGVCTVCAKVCHKNHDVTYAKYGSFFCDCGSKEDASCKAIMIRPESSVASPLNNFASHTFSYDSCSSLSTKDIPPTCQSPLTRSMSIKKDAKYQHAQTVVLNSFDIYSSVQINKLMQDTTDIHSEFVSKRIFAQMFVCLRKYTLFMFGRNAEPSSTASHDSSIGYHANASGCYLNTLSDYTAASRFYARNVAPFDSLISSSDPGTNMLAKKFSIFACVDSTSITLTNPTTIPKRDPANRELSGVVPAITNPKAERRTDMIYHERYGFGCPSFKTTSSILGSSIVTPPPLPTATTLAPVKASGAKAAKIQVAESKLPIMACLRSSQDRFKPQSLSAGIEPGLTTPRFLFTIGKDKIALFQRQQSTILPKHNDSIPLLQQLTTLNVNHPIVSILVHPKINEVVAIVGPKTVSLVYVTDSCSSLRTISHFSPNESIAGGTADEQTSSAPPTLANLQILKCFWLYPSQLTLPNLTHVSLYLAVVTENYVKVYVTNEVAGMEIEHHEEPQCIVRLAYHLVIPDNSIVDACHVGKIVVGGDVGGGGHLVILSRQGTVYQHSLSTADPMDGSAGPLYISTSLQIFHQDIKPDEDGNVCGGGKAMFYSSSLNIFIVSFLNGDTYFSAIGAVSRVSGLDIPNPQRIILNENTHGSLKGFKEFPDVPGFIFCFSSKIPKPTQPPFLPTVKDVSKPINTTTTHSNYLTTETVHRPTILNFSSTTDPKGDGGTLLPRLNYSDVLNDMEAYIQSKSPTSPIVFSIKLCSPTITDILAFADMTSSSNRGPKALTLGDLSQITIMMLTDDGDLYIVPIKENNPTLAYSLGVEGPLCYPPLTEEGPSSHQVYEVPALEDKKIVGNDTCDSMAVATNRYNKDRVIILPPVDHFESCELTTDVEFGGADFLEVYDRTKLAHRLGTPGLYVAAIPRCTNHVPRDHKDDGRRCPKDYFELDITYKNCPGMNDGGPLKYVAGIQIQVGAHSIARAPTYLKIGAHRYDIKNLKKPRWYDIPLNQDDSLKNGERIVLKIGYSNDARKITVIDNVKVYLKARVSTDKVDSSKYTETCRFDENIADDDTWQVALREPFVPSSQGINLIDSTLYIMLQCVEKLVTISKEKTSFHFDKTAFASHISSYFTYNLPWPLYTSLKALMLDLTSAEDFYYDKDKNFLSTALPYLTSPSSTSHDIYPTPPSPYDIGTKPIDLAKYTDYVATLRNVMLRRPAHLISYLFFNEQIRSTTSPGEVDPTRESSSLSLTYDGLLFKVILDPDLMHQNLLKLVVGDLETTHRLDSQHPDVLQDLQAIVFAITEMCLVNSLSLPTYPLIRGCRTGYPGGYTPTNATRLYYNFLTSPSVSLIGIMCRKCLAYLFGSLDNYISYFEAGSQRVNKGSFGDLRIPLCKLETFLPSNQTQAVSQILDFSGIIVAIDSPFMSNSDGGWSLINATQAVIPLERFLHGFLTHLPGIESDINYSSQAIPYFQIILILDNLISESKRKSSQNEDYLNTPTITTTLYSLLITLIHYLDKKISHNRDIHKLNLANQMAYMVMKCVDVLLRRMQMQEDYEKVTPCQPLLIKALHHLNSLCLSLCTIMYENYWKRFVQGHGKQDGNLIGNENGYEPLPLYPKTSLLPFVSLQYSQIPDIYLAFLYQELMTKMAIKIIYQLNIVFAQFNAHDTYVMDAQESLITQNNLEQLCLRYLSSSDGRGLSSGQNKKGEDLKKRPKRASNSDPWYHKPGTVGSLVKYAVDERKYIYKLFKKVLISVRCDGIKSVARTKLDLFALESCLTKIRTFLETTLPIGSDEIRNGSDIASILYMTSTFDRYDMIEDLVANLKFCLEIAIVRKNNWQQFCLGTAHTTFPLLVKCSSLFSDCEIGVTVLKLMISAIKFDETGVDEKEKKGNTKRYRLIDGNLKIEIQPLLTEFVYNNLVINMNQETLCLSRKFVHLYFRHSRLTDQVTITKALIHKLLPLVLNLGSQATTFFEILAQFVCILFENFQDISGVLASDTRHFYGNLAVYLLKALKLKNYHYNKHPNLVVYSELGRLIKMSNRFYFEDKPCNVCIPRETNSVVKLSSIKKESKYTSFAIIIKLMSTFSISTITIKLNEIKKLKMVKTFSIYVNNNATASVIELKNPASNAQWFRIVDGAYLNPCQAFYKVDFPFPVLASNMKIVYDSFHNSPTSASLPNAFSNVLSTSTANTSLNPAIASSMTTMGISCPRCNTLVVSHTGICGNCGENVFQCSKCRSINYDEKDPFLCINCGYCKYAKFEFSLNAHQIVVAEPINTEDDYKLALTELNNLMEKSDKICNKLRYCKDIIWNLMCHLKASESLPKTLQPTSHTLSEKDPQKLIHLISHKYTTECKAAFYDLHKINQQIEALELELSKSQHKLNRDFGYYDRTREEVTSDDKDSKAFNTHNLGCFQCTMTDMQHILRTMSALIVQPGIRQTLIQNGLLEEMITANVHLNYDEAKDILSYSTLDDRDKLDRVYGMMFERIESALSPLVFNNDTDKCMTVGRDGLIGDILDNYKSDIGFIIDSASLLDSYWELRVKNVWRLLSMALSYQLKARPIADHMTLPLIRFLVSTISHHPHHGSSTHKDGQDQQQQSATDPPQARDEECNPLIKTLREQDIKEWLCSQATLSDITSTNTASLDTMATQDKRVATPDSWMTRLLFSHNKKLRQLAVNILKILNQNKRYREVFDYLLSHLESWRLLTLNHSEEYFDSLFKIIRSSNPVKNYVRPRLKFSKIKSLINELMKVSFKNNSEENYNLQNSILSLLEMIDLLYGKTLKHEEFCFIYETYIFCRNDIEINSKIFILCREKLHNMVLAYTAREENFESFVCVGVSCMLKPDTPCNFLVVSIVNENLAAILQPLSVDQSQGHFYMIIEKDLHQEDYLQGRMQENPYSSTAEGLGPTMRDIKNKICRDCELIALLEDDTGMELLVDNKIINLNLLVKNVFDKVWLPTHSASDTMLIIYRMRGLLGDATEEFIETLDEIVTTSTNQQSNESSTSQQTTDDNYPGSLKEYGDSGLDTEVSRKISILEKTSYLAVIIQKLKDVIDPLCISPSLQTILDNVAYMVRSTAFVQKNLLPNSMAMLPTITFDHLPQDSIIPGCFNLVDILFDLFFKILPVNQQAPPGHKSPSPRVSTSEGNRAEDKLLQSILDLLYTILSHNTDCQYVPDSMLYQKILGVLDEPSLKATVCTSILKLLPYLTADSLKLMDETLRYFAPAFDFVSIDQNQSPQTTAKLDQFCNLLLCLPPNTTLIPTVVTANQATIKFVKALMPIEPATDSRADGAITVFEMAMHYISSNCLMNPVKSSRSPPTADLKSLITKLPSLPYVLRVLTGLFQAIPPLDAQKVLSDGADDLLHLLHQLEQISTDDHMGTLAESLMNTLLKIDPSVQQKIERIRQHTKMEKKKLAMAKREKRLESLGMKTNVKGQVIATSDATNTISSHLDNLTDESGFVCCICFEGYKFHPKKVLAIYTLVRKCELMNVTKKTRKIGHSTFTNFNIVHMDCHYDSMKQTKSRNEWESATLINSNVPCNSLLPLWGINITDTAFVQPLTKFFKSIRDITGIKDVTYDTIAQDIKLLFLRFAQEKFFSDDISVGTKESNIKIIPYLMNLALYLIIQHNSVSYVEKNLETYINMYANVACNEEWRSKLLNSTHDDVYYYAILALMTRNKGAWDATAAIFLSNLILYNYADATYNEKCSSKADFFSKFSLLKSSLLYFLLCESVYGVLFTDVDDIMSISSWTVALNIYIRKYDENIMRACQQLTASFDKWAVAKNLEELLAYEDIPSELIRETLRNLSA